MKSLRRRQSNEPFKRTLLKRLWQWTVSKVGIKTDAISTSEDFDATDIEKRVPPINFHERVFEF